MTNERTDIHRPSAIIPADYEFVSFLYVGPVQFNQHYELAAIREHEQTTGGRDASHNHGGSCHVCGASANYLAIYYHAKSNEYIHTGETCALKMGFSIGDMNAFRKKVGLARVMVAGQRKAFAFLADKSIARAFEVWESEERGQYEEITIRDIVSKLIRYGSISEPQVNFIKTLLSKIDNRPIVEAERKAAYDAAGPAPAGRQTVSGVVLALKVVDKQAFYYGDSTQQTKILVQLENGSKVWGNRFSSVEKGDKVTFKATFEVSKDDPKFGFYKRAIDKAPAQDDGTEQRLQQDVRLDAENAREAVQ